MSEVLVANHHTGQIVFPRVVGQGINGQPVISHTTINPGQVVLIDPELWKQIEGSPQIQHLISIGKLAVVKKQHDEVPSFEGPTNDPEIPIELQENQEVEGNVFQSEPAKAKAKAGKPGTVTID